MSTFTSIVGGRGKICSHCSNHFINDKNIKIYHSDNKFVVILVKLGGVITTNRTKVTAFTSSVVGCGKMYGHCNNHFINDKNIKIYHYNKQIYYRTC